MLVAVLGAVSAPAMAMPDELLTEGVYKAKNVAVSSYTSVPNEDTIAAVQEFVQLWAYTDEQVKLAKLHQQEGKMTDADREWIRFSRRHNPVKMLSYHLERRLEFYQRAHNWNAENKYNRYYNYVMQPKQDTDLIDTPSKGYTNSYGWNVLAEEVQRVESVIENHDDIIDVSTMTVNIMDASKNVGESIDNEELRYYLNEILWFSSKQTAKELFNHAPKPLNL